MSEPAAGGRAQASVAADLLAHGSGVHRLSAVLTVVALASVPAMALVRPDRPAMALATLAVLAGLAELWFALRVGFDARTFARLARGDITASDFDAAMATLELMPAGKTGRPIAARAGGALRLLAWQAALLLAQVALLIAAGWLLAAAKG
jgi:hypothetical protein